MTKRFLLILLLSMVAVSVTQANDLSVLYTDNIGADSAGTRVDTIYTPAMRIQDFDRIWLTINLAAHSKDSATANYVAGSDTVFANDTFFVFFQSSADQANWTINEQDTLISIKKGANDTIVNIANSISRDSANWVGNYGRVRIVHRNAVTDAVEIADNNYRKTITAWLSTVRH